MKFFNRPKPQKTEEREQHMALEQTPAQRATAAVKKNAAALQKSIQSAVALDLIVDISIDSVQRIEDAHPTPILVIRVYDEILSLED